MSFIFSSNKESINKMRNATGQSKTWNKMLDTKSITIKIETKHNTKPYEFNLQ